MQLPIRIDESAPTSLQVQIAQEIQSKIPTDETATFNADEMIRICEENLVNPPASTSTPAGVEATPTVSPSIPSTP